MNRKYLFVLPVVLLLASCSASKSSYKYVNPEEPQGDYGPEVEAGIVLDGKGNEAIYDNSHIYIINSADEYDENFSEVKFGFGEKGLLAYAYVSEKAIFENTNQYIYNQDSFELYINPSPYKDDLRSNCVQFRVSPLLREETWIGMKSPVDDYTWTRYYVPFRYATHIDGKVITSEREMYDDSFYNSQGVGYEFYIPYTSLGLDYNPHGLDILPAMVTAHSVYEDDRVWSPYNGIAIEEVDRYISVGNRTYKEQGDNIFDTDYSTSGFLLDHQLDDTYPYIINFGVRDQYAGFNVYGTKYHARCEVSLIRILENDQFPKVGIGSYGSKGQSMLFLDPRPTKDCYEALLVNRVKGQDWEWSTNPPSWKGPETYDNPIPLDVVRYEDILVYFMNGQEVFRGSDNKIGSGPSRPVIMTMNYTAEFNNFSVSTDEDEIIDLIGDVDPYLSADATSGYSLSNGVYTQSGTRDQYGLFRYQGTSYRMSTVIRIGSNLENDQFPKIGVGEMTDNNLIQCYLFDPRPTKDYFNGVNASKIGTNDWVWGPEFWAGEQNYNRDIKVTLERNGNVSKIYMDDILAYTLQDNGFGNIPSHPMFFTMNHSGTFSNVTLITY